MIKNEKETKKIIWGEEDLKANFNIDKADKLDIKIRYDNSTEHSLEILDLGKNKIKRIIIEYN